jgi:hypothetical protein
LHVLAADTGLPIAHAVAIAGWEPADTDDAGVALVPLRETLPSAGRDETDRHRVATISVMASGYFSDSSPLPAQLAVPITVKLTPMAHVRGRVVDESGMPLAGARVSFDDAAAAETSADGRFDAPWFGDVEQPADGAHDPVHPVEVRAIMLTSDARLEGRVEASLRDHRSADLTITCRPVPFARVVILVTTNAVPVAGATVNVFGGMEGRTDFGGRFLADKLEPGHVMVEVSSSAKTVRRELDVKGGEQAEVAIRIGEGWYLEGRVVAQGVGLEGVEMRSVFDDSSCFEISHADGSFRLGPIPIGVHDVEINALSAERRIFRTVEVHRGDAGIVIDLTSVAIRGRVVRQGRPVVASVRIVCGGEHRPSSSGVETGSFIIEGVPAGSSCDLVIELGDGTVRSLPIEIPASGSLELGDVSLDGATISGHANVTEGKIAFIVERTGSSRIDGMSVPVGPDGRFELASPSGFAHFLAEVVDSDEGPVLGVIEPGAPLNLVFPPEAKLRVTVERSGTPISATATVTQWSGAPSSLLPPWWVGGSMADEQEDEMGAIIGGLPAGHFTIRVEADGQQLSLEVDLVAGQTVEKSVTLP